MPTSDVEASSLKPIWQVTELWRVSSLMLRNRTSFSFVTSDWTLLAEGRGGGERCEINTAEMVSGDGAVGRNGLDYRGVVIRFQAATNNFTSMFSTFRPVPEPIQPFIFRVLGADYLPESKVKIKNGWSYTSSPLYGFSERKLPSHSSGRNWQGNGENFTVRCSVICDLHECCLNYCINKDKMGETCSTNDKV